MWAHWLDANAANDGHDGNALKKGCTARRRENLVQAVARYAGNTVDTVLHPIPRSHPSPFVPRAPRTPPPSLSPPYTKYIRPDIFRLSANSAQDQRRAQSLFLARSIVSMAQLRKISVAYVRARAPVDLDTLPSLNIEFVGRCVTAARWRDGGMARWDGAVTSTGRRDDEFCSRSSERVAVVPRSLYRLHGTDAISV
ncbi:hypothetical protein C8F04DRAFT_1266590 [Mycena alexandri]|uniref:Uncharacterized protein n=1 Tax=Mycena alexandri TaxID=1745969 RepID=A0AAD6X0I5_9AGAR|nr:hypothetical protein C8F04DRAFT_1266590 [Mycena alexandri]